MDPLIDTEEREGIERRAWLDGVEVDPVRAQLEVAGWVAGADAVTVLTGAGVSTDSGIPDFRGRNGVWTRDPAAERASTLDHYLSSPEVRADAWRRRADSPAWQGQPNDGHHALVALQAQGRLDTLVTQNTDGLHLLSGIERDRLVEVHGTMRTVGCLACDYRVATEEVLARVRAGEADPACPICGGLLKTDTVLFGESLHAGDIERGEEAAQRCDLFLAVGTTLAVFPVAALVGVALAGGARVVIVNGGPTEADDRAHAVLRGSISEILPTLIG